MSWKLCVVAITIYLPLSLDFPSSRAATSVASWIVAEKGDIAPGAGFAFRQFNEYPTFNDSGDIAFGAYFGVGSTSGLFRVNSAGTSLIALSGQVVPGGNGAISSLFDAPSLNASGQAAFRALLDGTTGKALDNSGIYRNDPASTNLVVIAREGAAVPGGNGRFSQFGHPVIGGDGLTALRGDFIGATGGQPDGRGIYRGDGTSLQQIFRTGSASPDGDGFLSGLDEPIMNDAGDVAVLAGVRNSTTGYRFVESILRGNGVSETQLAKTGQLTPEGNGRFNLFSYLGGLNAAGAVTFGVELAEVSGPSDVIDGVYRSDGVTTVKIAREGDVVPGTADVITSFRKSTLNDAGQVAFSADVNGFGGGFGQALALFIGDGNSLRQVARHDDLTPGSTDRFVSFGSPTINNLGQLAFMATTIDDQSLRKAGLYRYDPANGIVPIARVGDVLFGDVVTKVDMAQQRGALNDLGQIAFSFTLSNGRHGIAVTAVPEPAALKTLALVAPLLCVVCRRRPTSCCLAGWP